MGEPVSKLLKWAGPPEDQAVSGSVVEFTFGLDENSYLATSYPHRPHLADKRDVRTIAVLNMPFVLEKIEQLRPRYIMNVAIRDPVTWFMFCYRGQRFAYDSKWFPQKPSDSNDPVGMQLSILKEEERDQVSHCAFGESDDCYFLRSTDILEKWHPKFSKNVPMHLLSAYQDEAFRRHPRAVTFGENQTWVLYGKDTFEWSKEGLPKSLQAALQKGKRRKWIINKAVLSRRNGKEYVLVYDHGPVYYYFHREFEEMFQAVIGEWSEGMRASGRYPEHEPTFNYGHDNDDDNEDRAEIEAKDIDSEDENGQYQLKHKKSPGQRPKSHHPKRPRGTSKSEAIKTIRRGVKDLLS